MPQHRRHRNTLFPLRSRNAAQRQVCSSGGPGGTPGSQALPACPRSGLGLGPGPGRGSFQILCTCQPCIRLTSLRGESNRPWPASRPVGGWTKPCSISQTSTSVIPPGPPTPNSTDLFSRRRGGHTGELKGCRVSIWSPMRTWQGQLLQCPRPGRVVIGSASELGERHGESQEDARPGRALRRAEAWGAGSGARPPRCGV